MVLSGELGRLTQIDNVFVPLYVMIENLLMGSLDSVEID